MEQFELKGHGVMGRSCRGVPKGAMTIMMNVETNSTGLAKGRSNVIARKRW